MERFGRSWDLIKACFGVLRDDKELLLFPVLSGIAALLVLATFALPLLFARVFDNGFMAVQPDHRLPVLSMPIRGDLLLQFRLGRCGTNSPAGRQPDLFGRHRHRQAAYRAILGYAAIAATVGVLLKMKGKRSGLVADVVRSIAGMAWTLSTFLVVPVLVQPKARADRRHQGKRESAEENLG